MTDNQSPKTVAFRLTIDDTTQLPLFPHLRPNDYELTPPQNYHDQTGDELLDCGSIKLVPLPDMSFHFELDHSNEVHLIHCVIPGIAGECMLSAYATARGEDSWQAIIHDLAAQLRQQGVKVQIFSGLWGKELLAEYGEHDIHIIGYQGDRWLLRAVVYLPHSEVDNTDLTGELVTWTNRARAIMSSCCIDRGTEPMPLYTALPLTLPPSVLFELQEQVDLKQAEMNMDFYEFAQTFFNSDSAAPADSAGFMQLIATY